MIRMLYHHGIAIQQRSSRSTTPQIVALSSWFRLGLAQRHMVIKDTVEHRKASLESYAYRIHSKGNEIQGQEVMWK